MSSPTPLAAAIDHLAAATHLFSATDLDQPWAWGPHREGVRFALIGAHHELQDLAVRLAAARAQQGPPVTLAQRILAQYHAAYRELQAVLLGVTAELYDQVPAPGEWPLRTIVAHIVGADRNFFALVHYALRRWRGGNELPMRLPEGEVERLLGPRAALLDCMENQGLAEMQAIHAAVHARILSEFAAIDDAEMDAKSLWWEAIEYDLHHRLHRFEAHLRQHTIQVEKTLVTIGHPPNEARRLLRLVYNALGAVESAQIGAPELGDAACAALAETLTTRADEVATLVAKARELTTAVTSGDLPTVQRILADHPTLVDALDQQGLPLVLSAQYRRQHAVVATLLEAGAALNIFTAAAVGRLDAVANAVAEWEGWVHEFGRDGFTALQLACYFGHAAIVRRLLEQGADAHAVAQNGSGIRPLHAAAASGNLDCVTAVLAAGADPNAQQQGGFTALHTAADNNNVEMARLLRDHGADPNLANDAGQSPAALAQAKGRTALINLFG